MNYSRKGSDNPKSACFIVFEDTGDLKVAEVWNISYEDVDIYDESKKSLR